MNGKKISSEFTDTEYPDIYYIIKQILFSPFGSVAVLAIENKVDLIKYIIISAKDIAKTILSKLHLEKKELDLTEELVTSTLREFNPSTELLREALAEISITCLENLKIRPEVIGDFIERFGMDSHDKVSLFEDYLKNSIRYTILSSLCGLLKYK